MQVDKQVKDLLTHYEQIKNLIADPDVVADQKRYRELAKEFKRCEPIVSVWNELVRTRSEENEARELLEDPDLEDEMQDWAREQLENSLISITNLERRLQSLLLPKDPLDDKNIIVELRAGAGGDEAGRSDHGQHTLSHDERDDAEPQDGSSLPGRLPHAC